MDISFLNKNAFNGSVFLSNLHYHFAQTDGTYNIPNSSIGDLLKQAKKEIEELHKLVKEIKNEHN